jgi:energy-coupling factor transporter ATP-binding protein EcfA2
MSQENAGMPFERLTLRNVRCFRDATIELDPQVTVLLGENGSGKTTVVEALASLAAGEGEGLVEFPLARGAKGGEMGLYEKGSAKPVSRWSTRNSARRVYAGRHLFAYGRYRRVFFPGKPDLLPRTPIQELDELENRANRRKSITAFKPDNHLLRDLSRYLIALHAGRDINPRLDGVWKHLERSLAELGQGIEGIVMERSKAGYVPKVLRHGRPWELRELSDGYQAILVVVFDLILRYIYLFPSLPNPLKGEATVVIDEVDLHLHPRWQRVVIRQLRTLFPGTQFILTTHSPALVQGAIDRGRRVITLQEGKDGVVARTLSRKAMKDLEGAEIGSVLLEDKLFGLDSRYSPRFEEVENRLKRVQRKMSRGTATEEDRRQLFEDMETLQHLIAADELRRADGSYLSQMTALRLALLKDLATEIEKARG